METPDPLLEHVAPVLAAVPGVVAVVLGGSRASGAAHSASDYDIGLYFRRERRTGRRSPARGGEGSGRRSRRRGGDRGRRLGPMDRRGRLAHDRRQESGPPLSADRVGREGHSRLPGGPHQHGLSAGASAWLLLGDLDGRSRAVPPASRSSWPLSPSQGACRSPTRTSCATRSFAASSGRALFSIENAETAIPRGDQTYIAGCAFRSLSCVAQALFALNRRYLINEKGALEAAARLPLTIRGLERARGERVAGHGNRRVRAGARGAEIDRTRTRAPLTPSGQSPRPPNLDGGSPR